MLRCLPVTGSLLAALALAVASRPLAAQEVVLVPEGGRLDAIDERGDALGPCALAHTDVDVDVAGPFARVTLTQLYRNTYGTKIEAVYTFPMSHRAAVDRMVMTIGDRVVEGEVKERSEARMIYEAARAQGYVASLLEQERPNIFTQSVANIEPGAEIAIEISYVELVAFADGVYRFDFPMVVGPRYIPGRPTPSPAVVPIELTPRDGLVLLAPAQLSLGEPGRVDGLGTLQPGKLRALLFAARPIRSPGDAWWSRGGEARRPERWYAFEAHYPDGSLERGELYADGTGQLNDRWFFTDPKVIADLGTGYAPDTTQVPDASRITPMPARPGQRSGHDIALRLSIDTGGPGLEDLRSELHEIVRTDEAPGVGGPRRVTVELAARSELPNRDFVLSWRHAGGGIRESTLTHVRQGGRYGGGYFTLILAPPPRAEIRDAPPRELVFVLDSSGSMNGFPIEQAKAVMTRAIDAMRADDTFNVITFAGRTSVLWDAPRAAVAANKKVARDFVESRQGGGGTEMMAAIRAALEQPGGDDPEAPLRVVVFMTDGYVGNDTAIIDAVRQNARTTRVFSFGIGNSVNRYLLDGMAWAGRGAVEYVLLESDADEAVRRFTRRVETPVLTDVELEFDESLDVLGVLPAANAIPDLFDAEPLVVRGRYARPGQGVVTIRGRTAAGPYERRLALELPAAAPEHDVIATLWARSRIEALLRGEAPGEGSLPAGAKSEVIALGEDFRLVSEHTSFVAVEKSRITVGGRPMLVAVPIEMPQGVSYEGVFGEAFGRERTLAAATASGRPVASGRGGGLVPKSVAPSRGRRRAAGRVALSLDDLAAAAPPPAPPMELILQGRLDAADSVIEGAAQQWSEPAVGPVLLALVDAVRAGRLDAQRVARLMESLPREPAAERAAVLIADLAGDGHAGLGSDIARIMSEHSPLARRMRDVLDDESIDAADRNRRLEAIVAPARAAVADADRRWRLERVLAPALRDGVDPAALPRLDGRPLLAVLLGDADAGALERLRAAGLTVEGSARSGRLVVGTARLEDLSAVALVEGVRRVEPARLSGT